MLLQLVVVVVLVVVGALATHDGVGTSHGTVPIRETLVRISYMDLRVQTVKVFKISRFQNFEISKISRLQELHAFEISRS